MAVLRVQFKQVREDFSNLMTSKYEEISLLKQEIAELKSVVSIIENSVDEADCYERRDTIILSGRLIPEVVDSENVATIARNLVKKYVNVTVPVTGINTAHRLGLKKPNQPDKRPIIVKLCQRDAKRNINRRSPTAKSSGF